MGSPNKVDVIIGQNIRKIRTLRNKTRLHVALNLGLTQQAIDKYESGQNRIAASTLVDIADLFKCSVADFFHGVDKLIVADSLHKKADQQMLKYYNDLPSEEIQAAIRNMTRAITIELSNKFKAVK